MNSNNNMIELQMELPIEHEKKVFGQFDEHIKILERSLAVTLISRDGVLKIVGPASNAARAKECLTLHWSEIPEFPVPEGHHPPIFCPYIYQNRYLL